MTTCQVHRLRGTLNAREPSVAQCSGLPRLPDPKADARDTCSMSTENVSHQTNPPCVRYYASMLTRCGATLSGAAPERPRSTPSHIRSFQDVTPHLRVVQCDASWSWSERRPPLRASNKTIAIATPRRHLTLRVRLKATLTAPSTSPPGVSAAGNFTRRTHPRASRLARLDHELGRELSRLARCTKANRGAPGLAAVIAQARGIARPRLWFARPLSFDRRSTVSLAPPA